MTREEAAAARRERREAVNETLLEVRQRLAAAAEQRAREIGGQTILGVDWVDIPRLVQKLAESLTNAWLAGDRQALAGHLINGAAVLLVVMETSDLWVIPGEPAGEVERLFEAARRLAESQG